MTVRILHGDCLEILRGLPDESVHCVVTSPPYWGLRNYGIPPSTWGGDPKCEHEFGPMGSRHRGGPPGDSDANRGRDRSAQAETADIPTGQTCVKCEAWRGCLGLEPTPELYVEHMVDIFRELRRVLRSDGTVWLNLGDSYASAGGHSDKNCNDRCGKYNIGRRPEHEHRTFRARGSDGIKPKDLVGIPWMVAFALRGDGWYLRQEVIWSKPNPMPDSVTDRCTRSHEQIFMLSKSRYYFYDSEAIAEPVTESSITRVTQVTFDEQTGGPKDYATTGTNENRSARKSLENFASRVKTSGNIDRKLGDERGRPGSNIGGSIPWTGATRNKRTVWTITAKPFREAHFATFPPDLIEPCILASTSARGCCAACRAPWERVLEKGELRPSNGREGEPHSQEYGQKMRGMDDLSAEEGTTAAGFGAYETRTIGWRPTCECVDKGTVPAVVLDPFGGAGTTGLVADRAHLDAILIELNPEYIDMATRRIGDDSPLFAQVTS